MAERGETLSDTELARCRPIAGEGGRSLRAFCPFHGSDKQRSLRVDVASGRFTCFSCGVWGYLERAREDFKASKTPLKPRFKPAPAPAVVPRPDLAQTLAAYQAALPGSPGADYLEDRRIPLELAQRYGVGYAAPGRWAHKMRDVPWGRLVFPHTNPIGELVNLYGRAIGDQVPKQLRHDHLPGAKGYFNARILTQNAPTYVCEGPFDALSLMAAEPGLDAMAIFGARGWRWGWLPAGPVVFALDGDAAGQSGWRDIARQLVLRARLVSFLPPEAYGSAKDANEAWMAGTLKIR